MGLNGKGMNRKRNEKWVSAILHNKYKYAIVLSVDWKIVEKGNAVFQTLESP